jgi:hypothetical protein
LRFLKKGRGQHAFNPTKWPKFKPEPEINDAGDKAALEAFLKSVWNDEAKPYFMSADLPEDWDQAAVKASLDLNYIHVDLFFTLLNIIY